MKGNKKILFVDDEPVIVKIMKSRLQANHFEVETAFNGKEALELARNSSPDLILLDIFMPGMDGYDVCRSLKKDPLTCHIPVILFTASQEDKFIERGLHAGAEEVINKPFVAELLETINRIFNCGTEQNAA